MLRLIIDGTGTNANSKAVGQPISTSSDYNPKPRAAGEEAGHLGKCLCAAQDREGVARRWKGHIQGAKQNISPNIVIYSPQKARRWPLPGAPTSGPSLVSFMRAAAPPPGS